MQPWLLSPDNFTSPTRTPWGGQRIVQHYKAGLHLDPQKQAYSCVGESWEVSTDAQYPSRLSSTGESLHDALGKPLPYLVKVLDTAAPLSVQVHPSDDFAGLKPGESGKPEAWFIHAAEPGAGVYLGFKPHVTKDSIRACLATNGPLNELMHFIPVQRGDVFEISPGLAHALGAGVTLVEPQAILPGKTGVTYRFWDWNRTYDPQGRESPTGTRRALHIEESLAVVDLSPAQNPRRTRSVTGPVFTASLDLPAQAPRHSALVILEGEVTAADNSYRAGQSLFFPEACAITSSGAWAVLTAH